MKWFVPFVDPGDHESFDAYQGTAIFLSSINQYITLAIVYSKSYPYRKSLYSNRLLFCALILCFTLNVCITLTPPRFLAAWLDLKLFPFARYRLLIVFLAILNFLLATFAEKFLVEYVLQKFLSRRKLTDAKKAPEFEEILSEIGSSLSWLHRARPVSLTGDSFSDTPPPVVSVENSRLLENNNLNDLSTSSTTKMCPMSFSSPSNAETERTDIETGNETNA
uniref:Uncharacterized protein n=1 Tax=Romanomermis culicivorax TaxID=13658 RepID=A0A915J3Y8_ROMCU